MGIIRDSFIIFKNWADAINALPDEYQLEAYKALAEYGTTGVVPENISAVTKAMLISFSVCMENSIVRYNNAVENGKKGGAPIGNQNARKKRTEADVEPSETAEQPETIENNLNQPETIKTIETIEVIENNPEQPKTSENNLNVNVNVNDNVNVKIEDYYVKNKKKTLSYERAKESEVSSLSFERESESENEVCKGKSKKFVKPMLEEVQAYCAERGNGIDPEGFIAFYESKGWKIGNQPMKNWKAAVVTWEKKRKNESAPPGNNKKYDDRGLDVLAKLYKKYDKEEKENES